MTTLIMIMIIMIMIILMVIIILMVMKMKIILMMIMIILLNYITSGNEKNSNTFSPVSIQLCGSMALTQNLLTIKRFKVYCCDCEPAMKLSKGRIR